MKWWPFRKKKPVARRPKLVEWLRGDRNSLDVRRDGGTLVVTVSNGVVWHNLVIPLDTVYRWEDTATRVIFEQVVGDLIEKIEGRQ